MQLDELIAAIGSECDLSGSSASNGFSWLSSSDKVPKQGDHKLAASIRSGSTVPSCAVVDGIIRLSLQESSVASIGSLCITESDSIRLLGHFEDLLPVFLSTGHYNPEKLRHCVRNEMSEESVFNLIDKCTLYLEQSIDVSELERYIDFVSLIIDARFMSWFVKGDGAGSHITRLTAVVSRYRRQLFLEQQKQIKGSDSEIFSFLSNKIEPKYDGRLFYHQLV